ncbi:hypothetical protein Q1695_002821 [Nippostrongylus brasiliensis]|nr:hypothetical protein Q1695_002821 [Nippostrongylus brasiliensis]
MTLLKRYEEKICILDDKLLTACYTDSRYNRKETYYRPINHGLPPLAMSGLTFQLQSGIHKRALAIESPEISLRDLRAEAYKFIQDTNCNFHYNFFTIPGMTAETFVVALRQVHVRH